MAAAMKKAMKEAGVVPDDVDYVSAHATGTEQGDVAEGRAVAMTLGGRVAVSSLKGHIGHALGAAGGLETVALLEMMRREEALPTLNLKRPDRAVEGLNLLMGRPVAKRMDVVLKNNFALGGVNTSLVFRRI
jgi:3-oxoacyl-[acyl-carrier-protein] synthase II